MHPKYLEVVKLRKKGQSYREIAKTVSVSKNSVSRWCKNLKLPVAAERIIEEKIKGWIDGLIKQTSYAKR